MTTPNPPIPGHHLLHEGGIHQRRPGPYDNPYAVREQKFTGGCQCGATPPTFPNVSKKGMQRWHRGHKEDVRAAASPDGQIAARVADHGYAKVTGYVWCDLHGCIHVNSTDPYAIGVLECPERYHRPVYVQSHDPSETF